MKNKLTIEDVEVGQTVNVEARPNDIFDHNFTGRIVVVDKKINYIIVEDENGDRWEVDAEQLSWNSDEYVHDLTIN